MKNYLKLSGLLVAVVMVFTSCGGGGYTYQWVQPKYEKETYENVMVIAITQDLGSRQNFESSMVQSLSDIGVKATGSLEYFKANSVDDSITSDQLEKLLLDNGYDGVVTAAVIDQDKETNYVQGATYPSYYGRGFGGYYGAYGGMVQSPGYYTQTNVYQLQFNFYQLDVPNTDDYKPLVWTVQDSVDEPSNPKKFTPKYCAKLVAAMQADGLF